MGNFGDGSIKLPASITAIHNRAFYNSSIRSVSLPDNLQQIGDEAFYGCLNLHSIKLPEALKSIGDKAFANTQLASIVIPNSVEWLGEQTFDGCKLKSLHIDDGELPLWIPPLTAANFAGYFSKLPLVNIYIGRNLRNDSDFSVRVKVPTSWSFVPTDWYAPGDDWAWWEWYSMGAHFDSPFDGITTLSEIEFGKDVTELSSNDAFSACENLTTVISNAVIPPTKARFSEEAYANATLVVPDGTVEKYREADGWKEFVNIIESSNSEVTTITNDDDINISVSNVGGSVSISGADGQSLEVYDMQGRHLYSTESYAGESISLNPGIFIFRVNSKSVKVKI
ncbi:MAG: leucine-rich repeat domain-containing protein [Muribaculaceae bacterium]